ncbi:type I-E CRISPR-associated protein Cas6/Cse3/CasE [Nocardioides yefusunii]|uniref:Type I-E CRISPR-associated protein Cas6/Cse3/CasE n=1 Tax=Nocardioides yefusunii TaxID=2500546 RepID=A0ABW1R1P2_9ACTN|nr:type I-E CRISPR-associated protein Cas6/Cse3/CasE [Nocardioides yefusunii]
MTLTPTPSAATKTGVFWTQFPVTALTGADGRPVDWSDHQAAHRAVMRLFPPRLPGSAKDRRASSGILYRVDVLVPGEPGVVLVQSLVPPELTPALSRTTEVSRRGWEFEVGDPITLRVAVNPVRRTTRYYVDSDKETLREGSNSRGETPVRRPDGRRDRSNSKQTATVVTPEEMPAWLDDRLGGALEGVEVVNHFRDTSLSGRQKLVVDTFDLTAKVQDPAAFSQIRLEGLGRGKSYGCGLITARKAG